MALMDLTPFSAYLKNNSNKQLIKALQGRIQINSIDEVMSKMNSFR